MTAGVAIVEDDRRYRMALEALLDIEDDLQLVNSFSSAQQAVEHARERARKREPLFWDLVLMDIDTPGLDGISATRALKEQFPRTKIVMVTVFEEPKTILEAICAGADGYLLKRTPHDELVEQLRVVLSGGGTLTPGVAKTVLELVRRGDRPRKAWAPQRVELTNREQEVLRCLVRGLAYKEIAGELDISIDTVRSHIRSLYKKLQVQSATAAVSRAVREGLA